MLDWLARIAQIEPAARRAALRAILDELRVTYHAETLTVGRFTPQNFRVPLHDGQPYWLLGAHYDNVAGSSGANDNAASVVILLSLLAALPRTTLPLEFVFFDLEEVEMQGSLAYVFHHGVRSVRGMINLDLCGVGDTLLLTLGEQYPDPRLSLAVQQASAGMAAMFGTIPLPSDDFYFEGRIPTLSVCIVPQADIPLMATLPHSQPSVLQTMHNQSRDQLATVELAAMTTVYHFLQRLVANLLETP
jgi:aminopeptidase YwaD